MCVGADTRCVGWLLHVLALLWSLSKLARSPHQVQHARAISCFSGCGTKRSGLLPSCPPSPATTPAFSFCMPHVQIYARPSPTLSPTDPAPRGLLTLCPGASSGAQGLGAHGSSHGLTARGGSPCRRSWPACSGAATRGPCEYIMYTHIHARMHTCTHTHTQWSK